MHDLTWQSYYVDLCGDAGDVRVGRELSILDLLEDEPGVPAPPKEEKPEGWDEFLDAVYEGGKRKVKNTNPETRDKYPEVQASTLMESDPTFRAKVHKEFEAWRAKKSEETKEPEAEPAEKAEKLGRAEVGDPVTGISQIAAEDFLRSDIPGEEPWIGKVLEVHDDHVMVQDVGADGKLKGKPWRVEADKIADYPTTRIAPVAPKKKPKPKKPKVEEPESPDVHHVPFDEVRAGDLVHTADYGPQRIVERTKGGVRLESGILITKEKLRKKGQLFAVTRREAPKMRDLPPVPEAPKSEMILKPDEVKVGDVIEYEFQGNRYRAEVTKHEPDGRFRARVIYPPGSSSAGKEPSFDAAKIADRKVRRYDPKAWEDYRTALEKRNKEVAEIEKEHQEAVAEHEKGQKAEEAEKPGTLENIDLPSPTWKTDSTMARRADRWYPQYRQEMAARFDDLVPKMREAAEKRQHWHGTDAMWNEMSEGERMLASAGHLVGQAFLRLLTTEEKDAWKRAIGSGGGWQGASGSTGAHRIMGAIRELGVEGKKKEHEGGPADIYREEGAKDEALKRAVAKAMAFSRALYDHLGVTHVYLYRGTKTKAAVQGSAGDNVETSTAREFASFSIDPQVAYNFAGGGSKRVVRYRVPVGRLFISPVTFPSLHSAVKPYTENEWLVAGQDGLVGKVMPQSMGNFDPETMKMARKRPKTKTITISHDDEEEDWLRPHVMEKWWKDPDGGREKSAAALSLFDIDAEPDLSFDDWWDRRYEGGKKKVPNPNPKTRGRYPEIQASTAMSDPKFRQRVYAEFKKDTGKDVGPEHREKHEREKPPEREIDVDEEGWRQVGGQGGSVPGGMYESLDGERYYVKTPKSEEQRRNEILAAKLYELVGVRVPEIGPATREGKPSISSKIIPNLRQDPKKLRAGGVPGVGEGMAADAWLANWDVIGLDFDNMLLDDDGEAVRIDVGGALRYRAQGSPKGSAFGDEVTEMEVFTDPDRKAGSVFGKVPPAEVVASIDRVLKVPEDKIRDLVEEWGPEDEEERGTLLDTLLARRKSLEKWRERFAARAKKTAVLAAAIRRVVARHPALVRALVEEISSLRN